MLLLCGHGANFDKTEAKIEQAIHGLALGVKTWSQAQGVAEGVP